MHPSENGTIDAFQGEKGESQLDKKGNVVNIFNMQDRYLFPFHPLSLTWIPIRSVALAAILALELSRLLMCKKPICDMPQKGSKKHDWVIFF